MILLAEALLTINLPHQITSRARRLRTRKRERNSSGQSRTSLKRGPKLADCGPDLLSGASIYRLLNCPVRQRLQRKDPKVARHQDLDGQSPAFTATRESPKHQLTSVNGRLFEDVPKSPKVRNLADGSLAKPIQCYRSVLVDSIRIIQRRGTAGEYARIGMLSRKRADQIFLL